MSWQMHSCTEYVRFLPRLAAYCTGSAVYMSELQRIWSGGPAGPPTANTRTQRDVAWNGSCFALVHDALPGAMTQGVEIVAGLFRFLCGPPATFESVVAECDRSGAICYCIDDEMASCFIPLAAPVYACNAGS